MFKQKQQLCNSAVLKQVLNLIEVTVLERRTLVRQYQAHLCVDLLIYLSEFLMKLVLVLQVETSRVTFGIFYWGVGA